MMRGEHGLGCSDGTGGGSAPYWDRERDVAFRGELGGIGCRCEVHLGDIGGASSGTKLAQSTLLAADTGWHCHMHTPSCLSTSCTDARQAGSCTSIICTRAQLFGETKAGRSSAGIGQAFEISPSSFCVFIFTTCMAATTEKPEAPGFCWNVLPTHTSYSVAPELHTSTASVCTFPLHSSTSGAM